MHISTIETHMDISSVLMANYLLYFFFQSDQCNSLSEVLYHVTEEVCLLTFSSGLFILKVIKDARCHKEQLHIVCVKNNYRLYIYIYIPLHVRKQNGQLRNHPCGRSPGTNAISQHHREYYFLMRIIMCTCEWNYND